MTENTMPAYAGIRIRKLVDKPLFPDEAEARDRGNFFMKVGIPLIIAAVLVASACAVVGGNSDLFLKS